MAARTTKKIAGAALEAAIDKPTWADALAAGLPKAHFFRRNTAKKAAGTGWKPVVEGRKTTFRRGTEEIVVIYDDRDMVREATRKGDKAAFVLPTHAGKWDRVNKELAKPARKTRARKAPATA
jgi:hypothetical protein